MYRYYSVEGKSINQDEFIEEYSKIYYYLNNYQTEKIIEELISNDKSKKPEDFISFLRWKVGDKSNGDRIVTQYGSIIESEPIRSLAKEVDESWEKKTAKELYEIIQGKQISNVGAVYTLSLVFFITKGQEPIYDKFAEIALNVILDEKHGFREPQKYIELPQKDKVDDVMERYEGYKRKLTSIFGDLWKKDRRVDCALWTYGHLFRG